MNERAEPREKSGPEGHDEGSSTSIRRDLVEKAIKETALRLFAEKGFAGTNLQDIAEEMGVTRSAIYYYVPNKEDLLRQIVEDGIHASYAVREATDNGSAKAALEHLREKVWLGVFETVSHPYRFLAIDRNVGALPEDLATKLREAQHAVYEDTRRVIRRGTKDGSIRQVDDRVAAHVVLGVMTWTAWWLHTEDDFVHHHVADEIAEMVVRSLDAGNPSQDGIPGLFRQLRRGIEELERAVEDQ